MLTEIPRGVLGPRIWGLKGSGRAQVVCPLQLTVVPNGGGYVLQTGEVGTKYFRSSGRGGIHSTHFLGTSTPC